MLSYDHFSARYPTLAYRMNRMSTVLVRGKTSLLLISSAIVLTCRPSWQSLRGQAHSG